MEPFGAGVIADASAEPAHGADQDQDLVLVVLAAGQGARMRSALPKPLHPVAGLPMIVHVLRAGWAVRPTRTIVVVPPHLVDLPARLGLMESIAVAVQDPPSGTGDALRRGLDVAGNARWLVVLFADHPTLTGETVAALVAGAQSSRACAAVLTCLLPEAGSYGRIAYEHERPVRIIEAKDDDPAVRQGPTEINSGMMVFDARWLRAALPRLTPSLTTGEIYMTDLIELAVQDADNDRNPWPVATIRADPEIALGVNDRAQLAEAERLLRQRIRLSLMRSGVTLTGPESIFIDADVTIGPDTAILPFTTIEAGAHIGAGCTIGPHARVARSRIGDRVEIRASTIIDATILDDADVGPYSHVRGGSVIGSGVHVGTTAEINRARLGHGAKVGHFSYIGDATLGTGVNVGAGAVTANYDGRDKHRTEIRDGAFIGSGAILVAPVEIGAHARVGAGAVVTKDVAAETTVVGIPARPVGGEVG